MPLRKKTEKKSRLDVYLVNNGIVESRNKAQQVIKTGQVTVDGSVCARNGKLVNSSNKVEVSGDALPYVSRGGIKLEYALGEFGIFVGGQACLDVGASTGGFTDCLLKRGAGRVFAVDVGSNQLHSSLRSNPGVVSLEKTDIRKLVLPGRKRVDFICVDVSFISLVHVLPHLKKHLKPEGEAVLLIKPQFEQDRHTYNKHGVIKNKRAICNSIGRVMKAVYENKLFASALIRSPIEGSMGNIEFLAHIKSRIS